MRMPRRLLVLAALVVGSVTACGSVNADVYQDLQDTMKKHITDVDHRPVSSVSCTPHIHGTMRGSTAHLRCLVVFQDGTSYTADAEIVNQNDGGRHNMPDLFRWDSPPPQ